MDLNYLRRLVKIFDESTIDNLVIEEEGIKIKFARNKNTNVVNYTVPEVPQIIHSQHLPQHQSQQPITIYSEEKEHSSIAKVVEEPKEFYEIKSPMVGMFYRSPSPDAEPFVEVGQSIRKGQVLCIIEAMKLMNQIESDVNGTIEKILVENGKPVEFGQPLFLVKVE